MEVEKKDVTPIDDDDQKTGATSTETNVRVPDVGYKTKVIMGAEGSIDVNQIWEALKSLILSE